MLKLISALIKWSFFAFAILVAGNIFQWRGKTISDQIKTHMAQVESASWLTRIRESGVRLAQTLANDAKSGIQNVSPSKQWSRSVGTEPKEAIHPTEQEKLRSLIRDLNP
jgi:hypothetical protein